MKIIKCQAVAIAWFLIFFIAPVQSLKAQKYFFDNYGVRQGLSEQKVYTLLQDAKDYIWLGTVNGVSRFDGKKFENFTFRDSLAKGGVRSIFEDSYGDIWFGHLNGGITRYDGQKFHKAGFDSLNINGDITSIVQIGDKIWFTSVLDGAIQADIPVNDITHIRGKQFKGKDGLSDQVFGSSLNKDKSFICVSDLGLKRFNPDSMKFENYRMPHMTSYFSTWTLLEDKAGNMWFGTVNGGIYKYIMAESKMVFYDLIKNGFSSNSVMCITEDSRGGIWAGTWGGGIALFEDDKIRKFNTENGLKTTFIYDIIEDVEGNILIADQDNGLTIFKGEAFTTVNEKEILPDPAVNAIFVDKSGNLWLGTKSGISRHNPVSDEKAVIYNQESDLISENIKFFREDKDGNLWIGSRDGGVIKYNMNSSRFESQPFINSKFNGTVTALAIDKQNMLWIGTNDGIVKGNINDMNFQQYTLTDSLTFKVITALYCSLSGDLWIGNEFGSFTGLIRYDSETKKFSPVTLFRDIIPRAIVMDRDHVLWIGTGEGLYAYKDEKIIDIVTQDDGLLSNTINLLSVGKDGSIYIGTNKGLNRYFPEIKRTFSYSERNGFPGIETKPNAVFNSPEGEIWFGTANGATRFNPDKAVIRSNQPLTHIKELRVNYEAREMIPDLKLRYNENSILFDYYSICLTNPDVVRYKVKLEGADEDWRPITDQTQAIYSPLPSGKYTFMVIAFNSQGIWNKVPVTYHFSIKPPFWLTWWFIASCLALAGIGVVSYIKIREKNLVREKKILEHKVEERTAEVVQKSVEIEEKNRDITASIRYAERIQRAMLSDEDTFPETFILYMPKDIVSGDFYWMYDNGEKKFMAACDCTGHGVPGAFMSIIGYNSLNKVVKEYGITDPGPILDKLNDEIVAALMQRHEETIKDGMDMALISFDRKNFIMEFAGAYNPLYVVRKGEIFTYKSDRFPIGMSSQRAKKSFQTQIVDIRPGDMIYMASDGYADQFGAITAKKFKSGNVKKLLCQIWDLPVEEQKARLCKEILEWKGDYPQIDDILFIGSRVPEI